MESKTIDRLQVERMLSKALAAISFTEEESHPLDGAVSESLKETFIGLYAIAEKKFKAISDEMRQVYLDILYDVLCRDARFESVTGDVCFKGDFKIFRYFIEASFSQKQQLTPVDIHLLWPPGVTQPIDRYDRIILTLLKAAVPEVVKGGLFDTGLSQIRARLEKLEKLRQHFQGVSLKDTINNIQGFIYSWLQKFSRFLRELFNLTVKESDEEYLQIIDIMVRLIRQFQPKDTDSDIQKNLLEAAELAMNAYDEKAAFYKGNDKAWLLKAYEQVGAWKSMTHELITLFEEDLRQIILFGRYSIYTILLKADLGEAYLEAYNAFEAHLTNLSAYAFEYRMKCERQFRDSQDYLSLLDHLDQQLIQLEKRMEATRQAWRNEIRRISGGDLFYETVNTGLNRLDPIKVIMNKWNWVHHTLYSPEKTEERFVYEMERRRQKNEVHFGFYNVSHCHTQSRYAVDCLETSMQALKDARFLHPDKMRVSGTSEAQKDGGDKVFGAFFNGITRSKATAEHVATVWKKRQGDAGISGEKSAKETTPQIELPQPPLTLSAIVLHHEYLQWARQQPSLDKDPWEKVKAKLRHYLSKAERKLEEVRSVNSVNSAFSVNSMVSMKNILGFFDPADPTAVHSCANKRAKSRI